MNSCKFMANDNISETLKEGDLEIIEKDVAVAAEQMLRALRIDIDNDHNTNGTAKRLAKMFVRETFSGRYNPRPSITSFPNAGHLDEMYIVGPIDIRSTCAHHFQNIVGKCWIGIFPGQEVIGLSKFNRLVDWIASRPQIQEELTIQIADEIEKVTKADGIAIVVKAEHMCITHRGVKAHESDMTTSVLRGCLRENFEMRREFFALLQGMKGFRA